MLCACGDALPNYLLLVLELKVSSLTAIQVQVELMHLIDIFLNCFDFFIKLLFGEFFKIQYLVKVADLARDSVGTQEFDRSRAKLTAELHDQLPIVYKLLEQAICLHALVDKFLTALSYLHLLLQLPEVLLWLNQALQGILEPGVDFL